MKIEAEKIYWCKTIEDAQAFLKECDKQGIAWIDNTKASDITNYDYDNETCYHTNDMGKGRIALTYGSRDDYSDDDYEIEVYTHITEEELKAIDTGWKALMQIK